MFGVFWGLFLMLLLLGSGEGLRNGVTKDFGAWATSSGFVWGRRTTMPYQGLRPGRPIRFDMNDVTALENEVDGLHHLAPRLQLGGFGGSNNVVYREKTAAFSIYGDTDAFHKLLLVNFDKGRGLNPLDVAERRKVAVIGSEVQRVLFQGVDPIGEYIRINGVFFKVVGVFSSKRSGRNASRDVQMIHVPLTTAQQAFNRINQVGWFGFIAKPGVSAMTVENDMMALLRQRKRVHPDDISALGHENLEEEFNKMLGLFNGIRWFVWFVGLGTLAAGVIGVSNIMLIVVRERTREIGIRRAIGATPFSIVSLIMQEAVVITAFAGYIGLLLGIGVVELLNLAIGDGAAMFLRPSVDLPTAIASFLILVIGGCCAGLIPAQRAASIKPIEAIQS
nr:ABC transporter permease [Acanthopleuribacter pedis]